MEGFRRMGLGHDAGGFRGHLATMADEAEVASSRPHQGKGDSGRSAARRFFFQAGQAEAALRFGEYLVK